MRITIKSRRNFIRIISFALAFVVALAGFSLYQYRSAVLLSRSTGYTYRQSFGDLSDALSGMDSCLTKMSYTTSPVQIIALSERMCTYAACANTAISALPVSELHLEKITSFISQANGYTSSLARNAAAGIEPGSEEMSTLRDLSDYCLLYTSPSPRDRSVSRMPSSA